MHVHRSVNEEKREGLSWDELWNGPDKGLIACWERGREKARENPGLAEAAKAGQLVAIGWKGGVAQEIKSKKKTGTLWYLAMWQGLRGEDLDIVMTDEPRLTCTETGVTVTYTMDYEKYKNA